jgi:hypothetical protein
LPVLFRPLDAYGCELSSSSWDRGRGTRWDSLSAI